MNNIIYYVKQKKISLPITVLRFENIPINQFIKLNFYEKYIFLILKKGLKANGFSDLNKKISDILNINYNCVFEFVKFLYNEDYLEELNNQQFYKIKKDLNYYIDDKTKILYVAKESTKIDCDNVLYFDNYDYSCNENFIMKNNIFKRIASDKKEHNANEIKSYVKNNTSIIRNNIKDCLKDKNVRLSENFDFKLTNQNRYYRLEFEVPVKYEYETETQKITKYYEDTLKDYIPKNIITEYLENSDEKDELPRFIRLKEPYYKKSDDNFEKIFTHEDQIVILQNTINEQEKIINQKIKIINQKENEKKVELELAEKENNRLKENNLLIEKKHDRDINDKNSKIEDLKKQLDQLKTENNNLLQEKDEKIEELNTIIKSNETKCNIIRDENKGLDKTYGEEGDEKIKKVKAMYQIEDRFSEKLHKLCNTLDEAINASDHGSYDHMGDLMTTLREEIENLMIVVFNVIFKLDNKKFAVYYTDKYQDTVFRFDHLKLNSNILGEIKQLMLYCNARMHIGQKATNKNNLKNFKEFIEKTPYERKQIFYSIPDFFISYKFKDSEKKDINKKLLKYSFEDKK